MTISNFGNAALLLFGLLDGLLDVVEPAASYAAPSDSPATDSAAYASEEPPFDEF